MTFKYACFISYRRGTELDNFAKKLKETLEARLESFNKLRSKCRVYLDTAVDDEGNYLMLPGEDADTRLAKALCQSHCMIMIYNEDYFSYSEKNNEKNYWCTREYIFMRCLEKERTGGDPRLIIPILLRCGTYMPTVIRNLIKYEKFQKWGPEDTLTKGVYYEEIEKIAEQIRAIFEALANLRQDCKKLVLPDNTCAEDYIEKEKLGGSIQLFAGKTRETKPRHKKEGLLVIMKLIQHLLKQ